MYEEKINAYFDAPERRAELVEAISRLVRIRSVREEPLPGMPFGPGPAAALAEGLKLAEELGFATRNYDNYVGTADLNDKETALHILCHLDVVGEGTGWTVTEPYAPKEVDGMLYGRGTDDDKGPVAAVLLGQPVERMTGRGAGLSDAGLTRKVDAIHRGIVRNQPDPADPLDVMAKLGGFDIAGLCGIFLGGALERVPVLADGFISGVAALCAIRLCPAAEKAVFASHCSTEPAAKLVLDALNKKALITAGLHLGEGTGAVAAIPLWDMALAVYDGCYSFAEGGIDAYTPQGGAGC